MWYGIGVEVRPVDGLRPAAWAPAGVGKRGHLPPLEMLWSVLCIRSYSKTSMDELFMHYFHNLSSANSPPGPHRGSIPDPAGGGSSPDS